MVRALTKPKQPFHGQTRIGSATTVVLDSKKYLELCETCPSGGVMFGKSTRAGIAVALLVVAGTAAAEMYAVNVRRIDKVDRPVAIREVTNYVATLKTPGAARGLPVRDGDDAATPSRRAGAGAAGAAPARLPARKPAAGRAGVHGVGKETRNAIAGEW